MRYSTLVTTTLAACALVACSGNTALDETTEAQIDCLASKTVISISDTVRDGLLAGQTPEDLSSVEDEVRQAALETLKARFDDGDAVTYFNQQTNTRLDAIQAAVQSPNGAPEAHKLMNETRALAADCQSG